MERYAIYFMPPADSQLWRFGSAVIGYDAWSGSEPPRPAREGFLDPQWPEWTAEPRRYGFHGTLRAPFELAAGASADDLLESAQAFAGAERAFDLPAVHIAALGRFIALVPSAPSPELQAFASRCVRHFEPLRAPLSPADLERRLKSPLSAQHMAHLAAWGYPYVHDAFRFHMTLTGALDEPSRAFALATLQQAYADLSGPLSIDAIAICHQPARDQRFRVLHRLPLGA